MTPSSLSRLSIPYLYGCQLACPPARLSAHRVHVGMPSCFQSHRLSVRQLSRFDRPSSEQLPRLPAFHLLQRQPHSSRPSTCMYDHRPDRLPANPYVRGPLFRPADQPATDSTYPLADLLARPPSHPPTDPSVRQLSDTTNNMSTCPYTRPTDRTYPPNDPHAVPADQPANRPVRLPTHRPIRPLAYPSAYPHTYQHSLRDLQAKSGSVQEGSVRG